MSSFSDFSPYFSLLLVISGQRLVRSTLVRQPPSFSWRAEGELRKAGALGESGPPVPVEGRGPSQITSSCPWPGAATIAARVRPRKR